ncbi:hypothetical protein QWT87_17425 [Chryseobacterium sp. APV1]|uniref:HEAT repeat domain-containing protein n=1 Tax=Chryseobacterium urinae TaxID=3058400 RepID=A0ABT8U6H3_9FLAO|nr:hypothetical protein [Chryseobacterium sp. APV1]MDO3426664.1 hypothetical protein [Chryseobacterium sp. APV1]
MIKQKFGTALFCILTIICLIVAIFFSKQDLFFTIIPSLGSLICALCAVSENIYHKNRNVFMDDNSLLSEANINYSKLSLAISVIGYLVFIILGMYFIKLAGLDYTKYKRGDYFMIGISAFFIISYSIKIIKVIKKYSAKNILIISNNGIQLNHEYMIWSNIKNEKILIKKEVTEYSKYETEVKYLSLYHKNKKIEFKIDNLDTPDYFIEQYLKLYKNRFLKPNFGSSFKKMPEKDFSAFESIPKIDDLFSLDEKELQKNLDNIGVLAKNNPDELKSYCESITNFEETNLDSIYYALSENAEDWKDFLDNEFIRLFEITKKSPASNSIFTILDEILYELEPSQSPRKIIDYLYKELSNKNDKIRLKALNLINAWLEEEDISRSNIIIQKILTMTKDNNWKIRWCTHDILSSYNIFSDDEIAISFVDKLKAKVNNQYEIDSE